MVSTNVEKAEFLRAAAGSLDDTCISWPWCKAQGYGRVWYEGSVRRAHVVSCEMRRGVAPPGLPEAAHHCDNSVCVNGNHLHWDNRVGNMGDAATRARMPRGRKHHNNRLTEEDVVAIRKSAEPQRRIARLYGVHQVTISEIKTRKIWAWL